MIRCYTPGNVGRGRRRSKEQAEPLPHSVRLASVLLMDRHPVGGRLDNFRQDQLSLRLYSGHTRIVS